MSRKGREERQILLQLPGGAVPARVCLTEDEMDDHDGGRKPRALLAQAAAGKLSAHSISRNRADLLLEAVRADRSDLLARFMPAHKRLPVEQFSALSEAASGSPDCAAWLLQYRRAHYSDRDFEDYETHRLDVELGFSEPTVAELKKQLRLRYAAGGVFVSGPKGSRTDVAIPARIGDRDVIGVDAAAFFAPERPQTVTRVFSGTLPVSGDATVLGRMSRHAGEPEQPIRWRALKTEPDRMLLLAEEPVAYLPFQKEPAEVTWETCDLRRWLNGVFLPLSFTPAERARILPTEIRTPDNTEFGSSGGRDTRDCLFLLSLDEVRALLPTDESRRFETWWWLRSPGFDNSFAGKVTPDGTVVRMGGFVDSEDYAVRPAVWVRTGGRERGE